ncbi:hypothetical protein LLEC1_05960 [Akanthomyces lecanii]|uniref:Uncharacterized protein n=1 Tax=Cordyceps confragosa TaxID=2714763 RepID=A0A179IBQ3_CORDF|nr:hypothetical protein LLEC1_05960 [Akanthomyces lecanii]
MSTPPVAFNRLKQIATDVCNSAIGNAEFYDHAKTEQWNSNIIVRKDIPCGGPANGTNLGMPADADC